MDVKVTKEQFLLDANKMWNDVLKRDIKEEESKYAWELFEVEVLSKTDDFTYEMLHQKIETSLTGTIVLKSRSWFNWVMSNTYKKFHLSRVTTD